MRHGASWQRRYCAGTARSLSQLIEVTPRLELARHDQLQEDELDALIGAEAWCAGQLLR